MVSSYSFNDQDSDWNLIPEGGMPGFWSLQKSFEELRLTLEANTSLLEKWPGTLFGS